MPHPTPGDAVFSVGPSGRDALVSTQSDLRSVLRQDYNTISADSYITIEIKAILLPRISSGIETVAILEFWIVSGRTAVEAHNPLPRTRESDIKRMKIQV